MRVKNSLTAAALLLVSISPQLLPAAGQYFPSPDAQGGWRTLTDPAKIRATTGIDTRKLDEAFEYIQQTSQHGGLLVVRHGYLVYERYFGRGNREALPELASCGKAFTSAAAGIMLREKASLIPNGLDEKVFTPKYMPAEIFPLDDPRKAEITLGQLLSMSAGIRGTNPVYVRGVKQTWENPTEDNGPYSTTDGFATHQSLWCAPGDCYSYATSSSHLPAMIVRRLTGMEMEDYMRLRLTGPLGFGTWGYAMYRPKLKGGIDAEGRMLHTPGGGSIAVRSTDVLRFAYLMLHEGKWGNKQIVPAEFAKMCGRMVKYNPHYNHSFNFNVNEQGAVAGVPRDAFWKGGSGGYAIYVVPSLDMVIYKMGGTEGQYDPALTRLPVKYAYDGSRANWKPGDPKAVGDSTGKTLQMVVSAVDPAPLSGAIAHSSNQSIEDLIRARERDWNQAILQRDASVMPGFLADSYFLAIGIEGQPIVMVPRAKWLETLPAYRLDSQSIGDMQVHVYGDTAVVVMKYSQTGATPGKRDISGNFVLTDIWIKTPGGWRVAERHSSRQEKPAAM